ncbi:MAG: hypothetical protein CM1200mP12_17790 [Gammaproteobacteria bacterium]|nr:MAG: hypothetical protein CM1200mP12_17790 [Gammaproteobacteria bacterium]
MEALATEASDEERLEKFNHHWEKEGLGFLGAYADLMLEGKQMN